MTTPCEPHPAAQLMQFLTAKWVAASIGALAELGIADLVADHPRTPEDLAAASNAHPRALYRLLRAAASIGVFAEDDAGRFGLTPWQPAAQRSAGLTAGGGDRGDARPVLATVRARAS